MAITFIFTDLDNINFIRFRFFGLSEGFWMNVTLQLKASINLILELKTIISYYNVSDSLNKSDIEEN